MPYGTINVDTVTTSTPQGILGAGNASIMKNRLINSAMVIDQRNAGASVTNTTGILFPVDRFKIFGSVASKFTAQQNAGSITPPVGFTNYVGITSSSAYSVVAGDYFAICQFIEGFNTADLDFGKSTAKTITLSFQVYSSLTGSFGGSLSNSAETRSYPFTYSIPVANTWTSISITIAGDTTGTWLTTNGTGMEVNFSLGVGSTYSGTAGAWTNSWKLAPTSSVNVVSTSGATFYITGVQLEVGSSATGFEYVNYQTSLANCQRYYETNSVYMLANSVDYTPFFVPYVVKRAAPTVVATGMPGTLGGQNSGLNCYSGYFTPSGLGSAISTFTISAEL
jgi:hypothetical protein